MSVDILQIHQIFNEYTGSVSHLSSSCKPLSQRVQVLIQLVCVFQYFSFHWYQIKCYFVQQQNRHNQLKYYAYVQFKLSFKLISVQFNVYPNSIIYSRT